jgi:hypothetical protein
VQAVAKIRGVDISAMTVVQKIQFMKTDLGDYWRDCLTQAEMGAAVGAASATATAAKLADIAASVTVT